MVWPGSPPPHWSVGTAAKEMKFVGLTINDWPAPVDLIPTRSQPSIPHTSLHLETLLPQTHNQDLAPPSVPIAMRTRLRPTKTPVPREQPAPVQSRGYKRKHSIEHALEADLETDLDPKRRRTSPPRPTKDALGEPAVGSGASKHTDPVAFWVKDGRWPEEQDWLEETLEMDFTMDRLLARKKSSSNLSRKRSNPATSTTPSDQKPREEKSAPYRDQRYETLLEVKGSYMTKAPLGLASASQDLCRSLLEKTPPVPSDTLFRDDVFETTCQKIHNKNEARVIQDISRLIIPSAESLATVGAEHLDILTESVNEGWNNSIPLTSTRPQPDYSVGFRRDAFTEDQLAKLSPFIGDFITGDQSLFMATAALLRSTSQTGRTPTA
ncbi:hypothetical protein TOPH_09269 [Tolypocladium ophioglossoides CBS 100239]|uniref:DUF7924 domain-containing protein n=1 Tax=Tolypocladium ophioglossoides (strain CBS 100239) TaxID=1163406 RepID=A0A0L0MW56_TOLOC|nr:hypothetical protein TOPH_09269 [Tolypocladium ophioglossoides CBS 100239]